MKTMIKPMLFLLLCTCHAHAQGIPYFDTKGLVVRPLEKRAAESAKKSALSTSTAYSATSPTTISEKASKTRLLPYEFIGGPIDYLKYQGMCDYYLNPFKRTRCNNKLNYIKEAHSKILSLLQSPTIGQINRGVKEQILEKYASITNTLFLELEQLKIEVDNETYYRQLLLNLKN
jgi:hypothetical protein